MTLRGLAKPDAERILSAIAKLGDNPRPPGAKKLREVFRLWIGVHRVNYEILDDNHFVTIVKVAHRMDVYRE